MNIFADDCCRNWWGKIYSFRQYTWTLVGLLIWYFIHLHRHNNNLPYIPKKYLIVISTVSLFVFTSREKMGGNFEYLKKKFQFLKKFRKFKKFVKIVKNLRILKYYTIFKNKILQPPDFSCMIVLNSLLLTALYFFKHTLCNNTKNIWIEMK